MQLRVVAAMVLALACGAACGADLQKSLVTGKPMGRLAVAGRLDIDLHAEFMLSRTFEKETALNWYNCGFSGGGQHTQVGGNFGDFGLHVPHAQRDLKYPRFVRVEKVPALRFDGDDMMKGNFAVEDSAAGLEDFALELWVRDETPQAGEVVLGWQSADGSASSAPLAWPAGFRGSAQWRHVVVNCTPDSETWHVDGRPVATGPRKMVIQKGHRMVLGGATSAKPSFAGDLAALRLHRDAMTAQQIAHNVRGGPMLGTEMHVWWRPEETWWSAESDHFRHAVDKKEMAAWNPRQTQEFHQRVPKMFEMAQTLYRLYSERLALRIGVVSSKPEYRGDGIKYKIPIQPSQGSWMGWDGKLGFGWACQGAGHINPHELVHGCQGQTGGGIEGNYWEAHANFPQTYAGIYQTLPPSCASVSMLFPANGRNFYHDRLMFEHLAQSEEYGPMFISKLWYDGRPAPDKHGYPWHVFTKFDPDPRTGLEHEWMRMAQKCVTWDYRTFDDKTPNLYAHCASNEKEMIVRQARAYLEPAPLAKGWYRVPRQMAPQQLGYNICPLQASGAKVEIELAGEVVNPDRGSDWRAALVAVDSAGKPRYSPIVGAGQPLAMDVGEARELYLVVAATPTKIVNVPMTGDYRSSEQELFPWRVRLEGCQPLHLLRLPPPTVPGGRHARGGGFVAATAKVDATAYVGPDARVLGKAQVLGSARVEDYAVVTDSAVVRDNAQVTGCALVGGNATIRDNARVRDYASVKGRVVIRDRSRVLEHASTWHDAREIRDDVTLKGIASVGGTVSGSAILEGHYAKCNDITRGAWFTWSWGKGKNPGELEQELNGLQAQYAFEKDHPALAWDTHGASHAMRRGGAAVGADPGRKGSVLVLNGRDQFLEFPRSVVDVMDMTLDLHVKWEGSGAGQRILECEGPRGTMVLTPCDAEGKLAFVIRCGSMEQSLKGPALAGGQWQRVRVVLQGDQATLSVDGRPVAANRMSLNPDDIRPQLCLIGRGVNGGFFKGRLDDVSFYCNARDGKTD